VSQHLPSHTSDDYRRLIVDVIEHVAGRGDVVIVAHAASLALAGRPGILRVLVTAPPELRAKRVAESDGVDRDRARKQINESDAGRASYFKRFYGVDREVPTLYDLVVNTETLGADNAAAVIVDAARLESGADGRPAG
jgi:cytidylate kinase